MLEEGKERSRDGNTAAAGHLARQLRHKQMFEYSTLPDTIAN
jgi:hypothetical protein